MFYHLSRTDLGIADIFKPEIPKCNPNFEDTSIPRICIAPSIQQCIQSMQTFKWENKKYSDLYVYTIAEFNFNKIKHKSNTDIINEKLVYDAHITGESWILEPFKMNKVSKIRIWYDRYSEIKLFPFNDTSKPEITEYMFDFEWIYKFDLAKC